MSPIAERIRLLASEVAQVAVSHGRDPMSVRICGVSKRHPREAVQAAVDAGIRDIGESYVQEAREKLTDLPFVTKHFIGHFQTNKARAVLETFDVVQSIDRREAGEALARASVHVGRQVRGLVQINVSPTDRFGVEPSEAPKLAKYLRSLDVQIDGVMAIAPNTDDRSLILRSFEEAARLFAEIGGTTLSLGMSGDWREAVACGSTMIRIGTGIFGAR